MHKIIKIALSIALMSTLSFAKIYEDGEDGKTDRWQALGSGSISNIEDEGNRVIQLSGESRNEAFLLGGTNNSHKWDAREGHTLSWNMKFEKKPEIYVAIQPTHQSDKIRYIKYVSASDSDNNGWNRSGSILTIKVSKKFEGEEWVTIQRDVEQDLQAYPHPYDPTENSLIAINGVIVVGLGMMDDIKIETIHLSNGLVAHYEFEGNADDSSDTGNDGTEHGGVHYVNGVIGQASSFDGIDDYIEKLSPINLNIAKSSWSISTWVKSNATNRQTIVERYACGWNPSCSSRDYAFYSLTMNKFGNISFSIRDKGNSTPLSLSIEENLSNNNWYLITSIIDRNSSTYKIYKNGTLMNEKNVSLESIDDLIGSPLEIGRQFIKGWNEPKNYIKGQIDDLRIYNRALNQAEITALYQIGENSIDSDADGIPDAKERELGLNPNSKDSDEDGFNDKEELDAGTNPLDANSIPTTPNQPPVVNAGTNRTVTLNSTLRLTGTATDNDGTITAYEWREGVNVLANTASFDYTPTTVGDHNLTLVVTDDDGAEGSDEIIITVQEPVAIEQGSLTGRVVDTSGNAIRNATIQIGTQQTSSDANGNFSISDINVSNRVIINISKRDYINNSRIVQIQKDMETSLAVTLAQRRSNSFNTSEGATVEGDGGGALSLPADSYLNADGTPYSGSANLSLNYYPISTPQGQAMFPGNFDAINSANQQGTLRSYGFITMSLQDSSGNPLDISGGANISIPADLSLGTAPATMPLWYYDEDRGIWVEDGVATYDEATRSYRGQITRIAVYNLDVFMSSGNLKICVEDTEGNKLSNAYVRIESPSTNWFGQVGPTNSTGYMKILMVMGNTNLNLSAYMSDGRYGIYDNNPVTVTPNVDNVLPSCIVVADGNSTLTGVVQEQGSGTKLSAVKVILRSGGVYLRTTQTDSNGAYSFDHLIGGLVYDLEYTKVGYDSKEQEDITLLDDEDKDLALVEMVPIVIPNQPPVAHAGVDKSVTVNQTITLVGTGMDSDGSIVSYEWKEGAIVLANTASFDYTPDSVGEHNLTLIVTDDDGAVGSDGVTITSQSVPDTGVHLTNGLVAHYEFEGNADDSSGNGNDGIEHGDMNYVDGVVGQSASFDGIDDYIRIENKNLNSLKEFSISLYLLPQGYGGAIFHSYSWNYSWGRGFGLTLNDEGGSGIPEGTNRDFLWFGALFDEGWFGNQYKQIKTKLDRDNFIHVCATYKNGEEKLYINGELKASHTVDHKFDLGNYDYLIGTYFFNNATQAVADAYHRSFKGQIDELKFYNRVLTESEVQELNQIPENNSSQALKGTYYGVNRQLNNIALLREIIENNDSTTQATFVATKLDYGYGIGTVSQGENLQKFFLKHDASSLSNDPDNTSNGAINLIGKIYLKAGEYNFRVRSDDGYQIKLDNLSVAEINYNQAPTTTTHSPFTINESGYHDIDIVWWDQGGEYVFKVELSGNNGATYNVLTSNILFSSEI